MIGYAAHAPINPMEEELPPSSPQPDAHPLGSLENPIHVNGTIGEYYYLQRLYTGFAAPLFYHRLGTITEEGRDPLDVYELIAQDRLGRWVIAISHNHCDTSTAAPPWLCLNPRAPSIDSPKYPYEKTTIGVDNFVKDFPMGLPRALRKAWMGSKPSLAEFVESVLSQFTSEEWRDLPVQEILVSASVTNRAPRTELYESTMLLPQAGGGVRGIERISRHDDAMP